MTYEGVFKETKKQYLRRYKMAPKFFRNFAHEVSSMSFEEYLTTKVSHKNNI